MLHTSMQQGLQQIIEFHAITIQPTESLYMKHNDSGATSELQTPGESGPRIIKRSFGWTCEELSVICISLMSLTYFLCEVALLCWALEVAITSNFF